MARGMRAAVLMAAIALGAGCGGSDEVPQCSLSGGTSLAAAPWPKFRGDARNSGFAAGVSLAARGGPPAEAWRFATGGPVESSPVIGADGTVYVGSADRKVYAITPTGDLDPDWKFCAGGNLEGAACTTDEDCVGTTASGSCQTGGLSTGGPITNAPVLDEGGRLYVATGGASLYTLHASNGTAALATIPLVGFLVASPAIAVDPRNLGVLYVGSFAGGLFAVCPNGILRWSRAEAQMRGSPALADDGTIYAVTTGEGRSLSAIRPDTGAVKWSFAASGPINASPVVGSDGTIYIADGRGRVFAVQADGQRQTAFAYDAPAAITASPAAGVMGSVETLYVADDGGHVAAVATASGGSRWTFEVPGAAAVLSSPLVTADGTVIFGADNGILYALRDGGGGAVDVQWEFDVGAPIRSSPGIHGMDDEAFVYVGAEDGNLYALRLD